MSTPGSAQTPSDALASLIAQTGLESEKRFKGMVNATPILIWLAGTDGLCEGFNTGWLAFTGRTRVQEHGNGWAEGVHPDDLDRCVGIDREHVGRREPCQMESRQRHHSDECSGV
ncbi:MAG: hypothetical protein Fur007_01670 [Rhodoferax sp.]